jgi:hypothetical protein
MNAGVVGMAKAPRQSGREGKDNRVSPRGNNLHRPANPLFRMAILLRPTIP